MPVEIQWNDTDPVTGSRRFLRCHKFAGQWHFQSKPTRRIAWSAETSPTLEMWEHVYESLQRRYQRREGVSDADLAQVGKIVEALRRERQEIEDAEL